MKNETKIKMINAISYSDLKYRAKNLEEKGYIIEGVTTLENGKIGLIVSLKGLGLEKINPQRAE